MLQKLPIVGIGGTGKTTLILTLKREFKSLQKDLKPTKGIERSKIEFLNKTISVWDFGGQQVYREAYKKKAEEYFSEISDLFFVIDIQNQDAFMESIEYYREIVEALKKYSPKATINILINKFDPGFELNYEILGLTDTVSSKFTMLAPNMNVRVHRTSMFNPISIIRAFSKPLFENTTLYDNFQILFFEFINAHPDCLFLIIFTPDLFEIGNYFQDQVNQKEMRDIALELFKSIDKGKLKLENIAFQAKEISVRMMEFEAGQSQFYFTYGYYANKISDPNSFVMECFNLLEDVKKIMRYF